MTRGFDEAFSVSPSPAVPEAVLAEPVALSAVPTIAEPVAEPHLTEASHSPYDDLFEEAVRTFGTEELPAFTAAPAASSATPETPPATRRSAAQKLVTAGFSVSVMAVTSLLAVAMTLPSEAVAAAQGVEPRTPTAESADVVKKDEQPVIPEADIQAFVVSEDIRTEALERSSTEFSTVSLIDVAAESGIHYSDSLYTNDPFADIQWPFIVGVAMVSDYGPRWGGMHYGIDLVAGNGAPIQAIAEGTVRVATEAGGDFGVHVWIDHEIDGNHVASHYAHLQYGSLKVKAGDRVKVGDILGKVGQTGLAYGPHLHFEIQVSGVYVNPIPFMQKYAGTYY